MANGATSPDTGPSVRWHIGYNIAIWLVILGLGAAALVVIRQYGAAYAQRSNARRMVIQAVAEAQSGSIETAQKTILRAIETHPAAVREVLNRFSGQAVGMPLVVPAMTEHAREAPLDAFDAARLDAIAGNDAKAREGFAAALRDGNYRAAMALARYALDDGDFPEARKQFDAYWRAYPRERAELAARLHAGQPGPSVDAMYQLFFAGLWEELIEAIGPPQTTPQPTAEALFFIAFRDDMRGNHGRAVAGYAETVRTQPNQVYANARLARIALSPAAPQ